MSKVIQNRYTKLKDTSIATANTGEIIVCIDSNDPKLSILDANKKRIDFKSSDKYLPLSGGIVTGDLTVNQTINASDATIGGGELNIDNGYINLNNESSIIVSGTSDITCTNGGSILIQSDGDISFNFSGETASRSINKNLVTLDGDGTKVVLDNGSTKALSEIGSSGGTVSGDYLPLSGGTVTGNLKINAGNNDNPFVFDGSNFYPQSNNSKTLGKSSNCWNAAHIYEINGAYLNLSGGALNVKSQAIFRPISGADTTYIAIDNNGIHPMSSGYFSVGTSAATFNSAYIQNINATKVNSSAGFFETSDENLKTIIKPLENDFGKLAQLRKVYFYFKNDKLQKEQIGVIAQDIEKIYPEIVSRDENKNLTVDYSKLSVIALNAVDKLYEMNKKLEERLSKIEEKIKNL